MGFTWLTLPADVSSLQPFTDFVRQGARAAGMAESELGKLDLVVEEIVINVFRYAYPKDQPGMAEVGWTAEAPGRLVVEVCDRGIAYNPLDGPPPNLEEDLADRPIGGLGIFLVKSLTDSAGYRREGDRNVLSFTVTAGRPG